MCLVVFVGCWIEQLTDKPQMTGESACSLSQLRNESKIVRRFFSTPYIYEAHTSQGCGCGFSYNKLELDFFLANPDIPFKMKQLEMSDINTRVGDVLCLRRFIELSLRTANAELYSCWIGDENKAAISRIDVDISYFGGNSFDLAERQFLTIQARQPQTV